MADPPTPARRGFATTHWSLVLAAGPEAARRTLARQALEQLCRTYWYPLYSFVRHRGHSVDDAQDLTQSFFVSLLAKDGLAGADPARGRFRSYLLGALKHFLANEWHRARAQKRGGRVAILDFDELDPEARYAVEARPAPDPDAAFDREWAREATAGALAGLRTEWERRGKGELFAALEASLGGVEVDRDELAARFDMTAGALRVAIHRLRQRYRELLVARVAETVDDPADVDDELRHLLAALRTK